MQDTDNRPHPFAKTMIWLAWISGLILVVILFDWQLDKQVNPNSRPTSAQTAAGVEVTLKRNRQGHYVASGTINNQPVVFLLDTGASNVSVPAHLGKQLGLVPGRRGVASTANGRVNIAFTKIDQVQLGDIRLFDVEATLNPGMTDNFVLLGMSALKQLEFTQRGEWLILRTP